MESRGDAINADQSRRRLAIPRRSCDQCRTRKVGCDRGSPCSNCASSKLACTFGTVLAKTTAPKQRVLISAQYERKIDEIAEGLEIVKALLQKSHLSIPQERNDGALLSTPNHTISPSLTLVEAASTPPEPAKWDHSAQVNDFIKCVAEDRASIGHVEIDESGVLTSLRRLATALEDSNVVRDLSFPEARDVATQDRLSMPPIEAAVVVLRWAKDHKSFFRIQAVSRIFPIENLTEICQKVYFAVDEFTQIDFILANSYLSYIFAEYIATTGRHDYQPYYQQYRRNAQVALSRLPLLLPATIEAVAALTFGAGFAIECSKATLGWTYISNAASLSQTLGLHLYRHDSHGEEDGSAEASRAANLFWMVFLLEKSLSLRLGRSSTFRDAEIATPLPLYPAMRRCALTSRLQGRIYDHLYGPAALAAPDDATRGERARVMAAELRQIIAETEVETEIADQEQQQTQTSAPGVECDEMRAVYMKMELVKQLSLLTLVLRAVPPSSSSSSTNNRSDGNDTSTNITDECAAAAHETLARHQECMAAVRARTHDRFMTNRYLNWGIQHTPFVPFSVLFTRAMQQRNVNPAVAHADLACLEAFSESLRLASTSTTESEAESITHPYRLYSLLCRAARLYIERDAPLPASFDGFDVGLDGAAVDPWSVFDFAAFQNDTAGAGTGGGVGVEGDQALSHWFYGSQQLMGLLDDDIIF
ncbi:fungal-specific transcription factor domain-containing protein [Nemania sp. FL0916]|nr:fungal-specific transcription factor domain-containing protein [Nemania sp. FL0916]